MQDLPAALRALADMCEANGGQLPAALFNAKKPKRKKQTTNEATLVQSLVKKHIYGKA